MAQHSKREIIRLRPCTAEDGVRFAQSPPAIGRGPLFLMAHHKIELARFEDTEIDAQLVGHGIETKDFADFRKIGVEVAVEEYPASHAPLPRLSAPSPLMHNAS